MNRKFGFTLATYFLMFLYMTRTMIANPLAVEKLHQQALDQADEIDLIVELLAEAADKGKFNQKNKKDALIKLNSMRDVMSTIKDSSVDNLPKVIGTNEIIIGSLTAMQTNNFSVIPNVQSLMLRRPHTHLTPEQAQAKLLHHKKKLESIQKTFKYLGLSRLNISARQFEKFITKFSINKIAYKTAPYVLIVLYIMYVSKHEELEYLTWFLPRIIREPILGFKKKLMGTGFSITKEVLNPDEGGTNTPHNSSSALKTVSEVEHFEPGPISNLQKLAQTGNLIKIEIEPILKWSPATYVLSLIYSDLTALKTFISKRLNCIFSTLKNEPIDEDNVFSSPSLSHSSLDVLEIAEFKNLKNYFKYKHLFNLADHNVDRGFLMVGSQTSGYYMADILCAQLSTELNNDCRITQLNASDFVPPKKLKDDKFDKEDKLEIVLKDAEKQDLSIVVIKDIDWIYEQKERTIAKLDKFLDDCASEGNIIVIALTERLEEVGDSAKNKLIPLEIVNPTYEQRIQFLKAQLRADHATQRIGLEKIAKQTENCTLAELKKVVQDAYTMAYAEHKPFNARHLSLSATKISTKRK